MNILFLNHKKSVAFLELPLLRSNFCSVSLSVLIPAGHGKPQGSMATWRKAKGKMVGFCYVRVKNCQSFSRCLLGVFSFNFSFLFPCGKKRLQIAEILRSPKKTTPRWSPVFKQKDLRLPALLAMLGLSCLSFVPGCIGIHRFVKFVTYLWPWVQKKPNRDRWMGLFLTHSHLLRGAAIKVGLSCISHCMPSLLSQRCGLN